LSFLTELKRRNVVRVGVAYIAGAWLLTEVSGTLFPAFGIPDWGVRFVVIVLALGFLPALIISWAYELTPEGLKREKDVVREASITHFTAKRLDGITIGLIVVALVFIVTDRFWLSPRQAEQAAVPAEVVTENEQTSETDPTAPPYPPNSIAVLPFVNMSDDPGNEYFSDGIAEEILNVLTSIPDLKVAARTSAFSYKGTNTNISTIAADLNVATVLEGSVRKSGSRVRITAQLIKAADGFHLWSETYDRELTNIFEIQDEIAQSVVTALMSTLLGEETLAGSSGTRDLQAYEHFLQGRHFWRRRNADDLLHAAQLLERAVEIDPNYADAWTALGATYSVMPSYLDIAREPYRDKSLAAAQRALDLDPMQAEAYAVLAMNFLGKNLWSEAVHNIDMAIELDPQNATAHHWAYYIYISAGWLGDAHREIETAYRLDPLNAAIAGSLGWSHSVARNYEKAISMLEIAKELGWGAFAVPYIALNHALKGDTKGATELYASLDTDGYSPHFDWAPLFLEALQDHRHANEFAERMEKIIDESEVKAKNVYPLLALVGSVKFRKALADDNYIWALWYRDASAIRQTTAFRELVNELKLVEHWRETNHWPDLCRPVGNNDYNCD
jgi:TolB-like protein/Tfp pilus assembly protein PilF